MNQRGKHRSDVFVEVDHNTTLEHDPNAPQDVVIGNKTRELLRLLSTLVPRRCGLFWSVPKR